MVVQVTVAMRRLNLVSFWVPADQGVRRSAYCPIICADRTDKSAGNKWNAICCIAGHSGVPKQIAQRDEE